MLLPTLRALGRAPGYCLAVIGLLGLGLGATTGLSAVFRAQVVHPLPFAHDEQLVWLTAAPSKGLAPVAAEGGFSAPDFLDLRASAVSYQAIAGYYPNSATLNAGGWTERVPYANVSGGFFQVTGVAPRLGRGIEVADEQPQLPQCAVLSDGLWRSRFGADAAVLGRVFEMDNRPITVVGVMPAGFDYPAGAALWMPEPFHNPVLLDRRLRFLNVIGRMRPPVSQVEANAEAAAVGERLGSIYPAADGNQTLRVTPLGDHLAAGLRPTLSLALAAAVLLLLLACMTVGNLQLQRAQLRGWELALRRSLGAGRVGLMGLLCLEAAVLTVPGSLLGLGLAWAVIEAAGRELNRPAASGGIAAAALGCAAWSVTALLLFGLVPAVIMTGGEDDLGRLRGGAGVISRIPKAGPWLASTQLGLALALLLASALLVGSVRALDRVELGFNPAGVEVVRVSAPASSGQEVRAAAPFFVELDRRLRGLPGVAAAGMTSEVPLADAATPVGVASPATALGLDPVASLHRVLPGYFAAMGINLRAGRDFNDGAAGGADAVLDGNLAATLFPHQDAIGRSILVRLAHPLTATVAGVAEPVRATAPGEAAAPAIYLNFARVPAADMALVLRLKPGATAGQRAATRAEVANAVAALDSRIPVYDATTMEAVVAAASAGYRRRAWMLSLTSLLAAVLAVGGVFAVLAYQMTLRRRELAIRAAMGAGPVRIQAWALGQACRWIAAGCASGLALYALTVMGLRALIFGVSVLSPVLLVPPAVGLITAALAAAALPARRASRQDPMAILREP